ncbi:MAG: ferrous iron transport protein A [Thioploca sp.]|nr:ferrous iron transport protein A [Thioploca sp.]
MTLSLRDMILGDKGKVVGFQAGNKSYRKKLLAMGLTPGTEFSITRYAPLGDPVEISVRGYSMSLRRDEAATLLVEKIEP